MSMKMEDKIKQWTASYGLRQEFITPHCPQQNGMVERVIKTLKEQCAHRHRFESLQHASRVIGDWIRFYNPQSISSFVISPPRNSSQIYHQSPGRNCFRVTAPPLSVPESLEWTMS